MNVRLNDWRARFQAVPDSKKAAVLMAEIVCNLLEARAAIIFILDVTGIKLIAHGAWPENGFDDEFETFSDIGDPLYLSILEGREIIVKAEYVDKSASLKALKHKCGDGVREFMAKPLKAPGGRIIGGFLLADPGRHDEPRHIFDLICDYGAAVMSALINQRTFKLQAEDMMGELNRLSKKKEEAAKTGNLGMIGQSPSMVLTREKIAKAAAGCATVLLTGPTGTGKELAASAIHGHSVRKNKPFIKIDCASIPPHLLESEFFGYRKGAFTGADKDWPGLLREADGGTVLLDEIGEMPCELQVKLLRVMQERKVRPVGAAVGLPVDIMVIAATNRNLKQSIENGGFRLDLYHRLAVFPIELPALNERRADIPLLAVHFLNLLGLQYKRPGLSLTNQAIRHLYERDYPGNVRELAALIERAMMMADSRAKILDLPLFLEDEPEKPKTLTERLDLYECKLIKEALKMASGRMSEAADMLGLPRRTLAYKAKKYGVTV